jgi:hypothetical protein
VNYKQIAYAAILFAIGHIILWYQSNAQFFSEWAKDHKILMACLMGPPASIIFVTGVTLVSEGTGGAIWPTRFIPNSIGLLVFTTLTYFIFQQGLDTKNAICLGLSVLIIAIQVLWK